MNIRMIMVVIAAFGLSAIPAMAQMESSTATTITQTVASASNSTAPRVYIYSAGAPTTDLDMAGYHAFDEFAQEHPGIVRELHHNRHLINDPEFARNHPAFADFLRNNPKVAEDLAENPGNYLPNARS